MTLFRSLVFNIWFYGLTTVMTIGSVFVRSSGWRPSLTYAQRWARLSLWGLRTICGVRWQVVGAELLPSSGPALIASMHQSAFDTLVWAMLAHDFAYVLKRELTQVPLFGPMLLATGMIAVDRSAGMSAMRGLLRETDRAINEGRQIVIFPEGTRVLPGERIRLQPGVAAIAARTGLPVYPVATDSGLRWGRRAFRKTPGVIHIRIMPPIPPDLPRAELMERIGRAFDEGAASLSRPVDNSVGASPALLPRNRKGASQRFDLPT